MMIRKANAVLLIAVGSLFLTAYGQESENKISDLELLRLPSKEGLDHLQQKDNEEMNAISRNHNRHLPLSTEVSLQERGHNYKTPPIDIQRILPPIVKLAVERERQLLLQNDKNSFPFESDLSTNTIQESPLPSSIYSQTSNNRFVSISSHSADTFRIPRFRTPIVTASVTPPPSLIPKRNFQATEIPNSITSTGRTFPAKNVPSETTTISFLKKKAPLGSNIRKIYSDSDIQEINADSLSVRPEREYRKFELLGPTTIKYTSRLTNKRNIQNTSNFTQRKALQTEYSNFDEIIKPQSFADRREELMAQRVNRRRLIKGKKRKKPFKRGPIIRMSELKLKQSDKESVVMKTRDTEPKFQSQNNIEDINPIVTDFKRIKPLKDKKSNQSGLNSPVLPIASKSLNPSLSHQPKDQKLSLRGPSNNQKSSLTGIFKGQSKSAYPEPLHYKKPSSGLSTSLKPSSLGLLHNPKSILPDSSYKKKASLSTLPKNPKLPVPGLLNSRPNSLLTKSSNSPNPSLPGQSKNEKPSLPRPSKTPLSLPGRSKSPKPPLPGPSKTSKPSLQGPSKSSLPSILGISRNPNPSLQDPFKNSKSRFTHTSLDPKLSKHDDDETGVAPTFEFPFVSSIVSGLPFFIDGHQHLGPFQVIKISI